MAYQPLSYYERIIVRYVLSTEHGLSEKTIAGMLLTYTAFATRLNKSEFFIFQESESRCRIDDRKFHFNIQEVSVDSNQKLRTFPRFKAASASTCRAFHLVKPVRY